LHVADHQGNLCCQQVLNPSACLQATGTGQRPKQDTAFIKGSAAMALQQHSKAMT
jgi:hypothetical protein